MVKKRKKASEIFGAVDPGLKVIDGGSHRRHIKRLSANGQAAWDKLGGAKCPSCGRDALRFRPEDGVCNFCAASLNEKELRDERKQARFLKYMTSHNARIGKRSHHGSS